MHRCLGRGEESESGLSTDRIVTHRPSLPFSYAAEPDAYGRIPTKPGAAHRGSLLSVQQRRGLLSARFVSAPWQNEPRSTVLEVLVLKMPASIGQGPPQLKHKLHSGAV